MFNSSLTKICIPLILSSMVFILPSCKQSAPKGEAGTGDLSGMVLEDIPGSTIQYARQIDTISKLRNEGFIENGKKTGQWIEYNAQGEISWIKSYVNGKLEGTVMRMTFRNQVDLMLNYKQDVQDGPWTSYKFGKVIEQRNYKAGKLDGTVLTYDDRTFNLRQEVQYKDGLQDGYFKYYDDEGNVTLEYEYKKGEKVSGGMVEKK
jgi:antitoxin component YwqK of YwqJK toxin-antitoxin module